VSAIVTSAIGAALIDQNLRSANANSNSGQKIIANQYSAEVAMLLNGVNSFMYQLSLFPLYMMIATQKTIVCTYGSVFSAMSITGFEITLGNTDFQNANAGKAGVCLTALFEQQTQNPRGVGVSDDLGEGVAAIMSRSGESATNTFNEISSAEAASQYASLLTYVKMGPAMHLLDAVITWAMGVVSGLQDMVQELDSSHCKVVDYYIHNMTTCACGDDAVRIPLERRNSRDYAHWCSGTLKMIDGFGNVKYVYNPYTYTELYSKVWGMDAYLECISKKSQDGVFEGVTCSSIEPRDILFTRQGISPISVFQRCKVSSPLPIDHVSNSV
jgi:hypothetical protein